MKKIGLLIIAVVLAMGALGVGYAHWTGELDIAGTVNTGTFSAELTQDNGVITSAIDDETIGAESCTQYPLYASWVDSGKTQDNATATCVLSNAKQAPDYSGDYNDTMTITVTDAYPCYNVWVPVDVHCRGSVPIKVWYTMTNANPADVITIELIDDPAQGLDEFSLVDKTSLATAQKLHYCETARALVHIHPLQPYVGDPEDPEDPDVTGASPGAVYTFTITIHYEQSQ